MKETEKLIIRKKQPVITRHKALVAYLLDKNIIKEGEYKLIEHADYKDVEGQDVIGVLPLQLASYTKSITEVPLKLTPEMRGKELTFEEVEKVAEKPVQYIVREVNNTDGIDYYLGILEGYTDEDYELAYKYYRHNEVVTKSWKDFTEIAKARTIYMDIMNCLYGIFDIHTLENTGHRIFMIVSSKLPTLSVSLVYEDETETENVKLRTDFNRASLLKFVHDLIKMCL